MRLTEYLRWQVRLWLVEYGQRVHYRIVDLAVRAQYPNDSFARFVNRLSPWDTRVGYRRRSLRRVLYMIRYPIQQQRFWSLALVESLVYRLVPRPSLGRYESWEPARALQTQWLDEHSEYAGETTGDSDTYIWAALFHMLDVPWSRQPETWTLTVDSRGFVEARRDEGAVDFMAIANNYDIFVDESFEADAGSDIDGLETHFGINA